MQVMMWIHMVITNVHQISNRDITGYSWHRIKLFRNPDFTTEHIVRLHQVPRKHHQNVAKQALEIRSCLVQAEEYIQSASAATMATRPVLLYYGLMSLALAEILMKGTGDKRLERLRSEHAGHGLSLSVTGSIDRTTRLDELLPRLRATAQHRNATAPYGTFEVWRQQVRETPVPAQVYEIHPEGAQTSGTRALFTGADVAPPPAPAGGYSLHDAVQSLPQMQQLLVHLGINPGCARATLKGKISSITKEGELEIVVHPGTPNQLGTLYEKLLFEASAVNVVTTKELPSGVVVTVPLGKNAVFMSLPPVAAASLRICNFVVNGWNIGEFGSFYVALHICGNLVRYFPDIWMGHVERSSAFALLVQELCDLALSRLPVLTASELDQRYYFNDGQ